MRFDRRHFIYTGIFGAGALGLRSLATGIPREVLANPLAVDKAKAQPGPGRILILATSSAGDPLNGNVPGTYGPGLDNVVHPLTPEMAPTSLTLSGQSYTAAKPWADLPQALLDQTVFIHHSTYTNSHPNHPKVMRLMGNTARNEMVVSVFSKELGPAMQTTQVEPISLGARGSELLSFSGRTLSNVQPTSLQQVLGTPDGPLGALQSIRDRDLDRLHALYKEHGTENQRRMIDRFAQSRSEARNISEVLLDRLASVDGNGAEDQVIAAPILAAMNVSPVLTVKINFGRDNHRDNGLARESTETVSGVAQLQQLVDNVAALRAEGALNREVIVGAMNVFGRTMSVDRKGQNGRDHNSRHHCTVLMGPGLRGGVVGGIEKVGRDWGATGFDSQSGASNNDGDVPFEQTFQSVAKTIGSVLGVANETLDENITGGRVIDAALD